MSQFSTRNGAPWVPVYLTAINGETCIGCGRCFKVCSREVMHLYGLDEDGNNRRGAKTEVGKFLFGEDAELHGTTQREVERIFRRLRDEHGNGW